MRPPHVNNSPVLLLFVVALSVLCEYASGYLHFPLTDIHACKKENEPRNASREDKQKRGIFMSTACNDDMV